jgi:hypothetical protein
MENGERYLKSNLTATYGVLLCYPLPRFYATNRSPPTGLACPNAANVASNSATLLASAGLNSLANSPAVAGFGRAARAERTAWACSASVLGQGSFSAFLALPAGVLSVMPRAYGKC